MESADSSPTKTPVMMGGHARQSGGGPPSSMRRRRHAVADDGVGHHQHDGQTSLARMYMRPFGGFGGEEGQHDAHDDDGTFNTAQDEMRAASDSTEAPGRWNISAIRSRDNGLVRNHLQQEQRNAHVFAANNNAHVRTPYQHHLGMESRPNQVASAAAAVKIGRRDAWLKFLAHEASMQICLDAVLEMESVTTGNESKIYARELLKDGCALLKQGLGIGGLLLSPARGGETSIFWDDEDYQHNRAAQQAKHDEMLEATREKLAIASVARRQKPNNPPKTILRKSPEKLVMNNRSAGLESPQKQQIEANVYQYSRSSTVLDDWRVPYVEAEVVRIVGSPYLDSFEELGQDNDMDEHHDPRYQVALIFQNQQQNIGAKQLATESSIGSTGGIKSSRPIKFDARHGGMLMVDFIRDKKKLASGSVMVSELQRLAARCDALGQEPAPGFLKQLINPSGWKRKDSGGSMIWVRLVAADGSPAGHIVLSAKAIPSDTPLTGALGEGGLITKRSKSRDTPSVTEKPLAPQITGSDEDFDEVNIAADNDCESANGDGECEPQMIPTVFGENESTKQHTTGGYLHVSVKHVYESLLDSALLASGCGQPGSSLMLKGEWSWLSDAFCAKFGVRKEYALLSYLHWILERHIVQPNSKCFEVMYSKLSAVGSFQCLAQNMPSSELALLEKVKVNVKNLLAKAFENYYALQENYEDKVGGSVFAARSQEAAVVLKSACKLLLFVHGDNETATNWCIDRFRKAARYRFHAILATIESKHAVSDAKKVQSRVPIEYKKVHEMCYTLMEEIRADEAIQASHVLLEGVQLPRLTSIEYIKGFGTHIRGILRRWPPSTPRSETIQLVKDVGTLQHFVERHNYLDASVSLNAYELFREHIIGWIDAFALKLKRGISIIDDSGPAEVQRWKDLKGKNGKRMVVPLVEALLREIQDEMQVFKPIVCFWPTFGTEIEAAAVSIIRKANSVASRHCGLVQSVGQSPNAKDPRTQKRRVAWRWNQTTVEADDGDKVTNALRRGTTIYQALLLNTLRRLLAVVPQLESTLIDWCRDIPSETSHQSPGGGIRSSMSMFPPKVSGPDRLAEEAPHLGAHWAQLVKEIRTEYYACITLTAESISKELSASSATSVQGVLRRGGMETSKDGISRRVIKVLEQTAPTLQILANILDSRVFVALSRGLWDLSAREVLQYAEDLQEGEHGGPAWKGRQNATVVLNSVDSFFKTQISNAMGSDLHSKDLAAPQHSQRASSLLASNTAQLDLSFDVY